MIKVEDLRKYYKVHVREAGFLSSLKSLFLREFRTVKAVDGISFEIPEGQIVGFLGPNGAGKTTTMKMLTGLLHPTSGKIHVAGYIPFQQKNAFKKRISLVMGQKSQLVWDLPASETFLIHKEIYEIPDREYKQQLDDLVDLLDLHGLLEKPVRQLSLGERMKCELAAALLHRPDIVFLDEPTIGLDVNMQESVRRFIGEYNRYRKATILLTSHYMADVSALCERVMVINRGLLLYDGSIRELIARYAPYKRIQLTFSHEPDLRMLAQIVGGTDRIKQAGPLTVEVEVERERVSEISSNLLSHFPLSDLTIEEPPMEAVISRAFASAPDQNENANKEGFD